MPEPLQVGRGVTSGAEDRADGFDEDIGRLSYFHVPVGSRFEDARSEQRLIARRGNQKAHVRKLRRRSFDELQSAHSGKPKFQHHYVGTVLLHRLQGLTRSRRRKDQFEVWLRRENSRIPTANDGGTIDHKNAFDH